jgi:cobalamin synthase
MLASNVEPKKTPRRAMSYPNSLAKRERNLWLIIFILVQRLVFLMFEMQRMLILLIMIILFMPLHMP